MKTSLLITTFLAFASCAATTVHAQSLPTMTSTVNVNVSPAAGVHNAAANIAMTAPGSGVNGPANSNVGINVNCNRTNYMKATTTGELDCQYLTLRQDGPGSDGSGLLIDAQNTGLGFLSDTEMVASSVNKSTGAVKFAEDIQQGVINIGKTMYGTSIGANVGAGQAALLVQAAGGAAWNYALQAYDASGVEYYSVDGKGNSTQTGSANVAKSVYVGGVLQATATRINKLMAPRMVEVADCGTIVRSTGDGELKLSVPAGLPIGCRIGVIQAGEGAVVIDGDKAMQIERLGAHSATQQTSGRFTEASLLIDSKSSFLVGGQVTDASGHNEALADNLVARSSPVSLVSWRN